MRWSKLQPIIGRLLGRQESFDRRPVPVRTESETLHSRRALLAGLGAVGLCAVTGASLVAPGRAGAATLIEGAGQADWSEAELERADLNGAEIGDAELIETDLDEADLDEAELIEVQSGRRGRGGRGRRGGGRRSRGGGRRRSRDSGSRRRVRRRRPRRRHYYARPRRRRYSPWELRYLCRDYYFRREFPLLCAGVEWWL